MTRLSPAAVVLVGLSVAVASASLSAQASVRTAIETANKQFVAAFAKGDAAQIAGMYTADGIAYPPNSEPVQGRDALQKLWKGAMDTGVRNVTLTTTEVEGQGDTAYEVGTYEMKVDGGKVADRGKYLVVWKRQQGQWRLHRDIWNTSMPPAK